MKALVMNSSRNRVFSLEIVDDQRQLEKLGFLMAETMTIAYAFHMHYVKPLAKYTGFT